MLGNNPLIFGFSLTEGEDGKPEIGHLQPGSPAYLSGQVNEGDRILGIKWDNKESIDVSDAGLRELNEMLSESGGDKVNITVRKVDGTTKQVTLHKEKMAVEDEDNNKVKGFLLKGARIVGYISLPDFYSDWEDNSGVNGCANDVGKEIIKLKKENIQGLIIDLRYNGGGSLKEAVELTGIFIDAGPVAQLKERETKISTLKDVNRGTIYDGPLVILVNGNTASASELVAGSLQDYNRALIVGSPTYGKATGQIVLPLDTTVNIKTYNGKSQAESYIKLTTFKIYRVDGTTAQIKGVIPNIILPEAADANQKDREANEKFALNASPIDPNKYYTPLQPIDVVNPQNAARQELDSSAYFKATREYVQKMKTTFQKKNVSLLVDDFLKQNNGASEPPDFDDYPVKTPIYSVANHAFEERRIGNNKNLKDANEEFRANVADDPYVRIGYQVVSAMIK
jgi:carboxyl-terminal processing protease